MFDVQFITHFTASISYPDSARISLEEVAAGFNFG